MMMTLKDLMDHTDLKVIITFLYPANNFSTLRSISYTVPPFLAFSLYFVSLSLIRSVTYRPYP